VLELAVLVPFYNRFYGANLGVVSGLAGSQGLRSAIDDGSLSFFVVDDAPSEAGCFAEGAVGP